MPVDSVHKGDQPIAINDVMIEKPGVDRLFSKVPHQYETAENGESIEGTVEAPGKEKFARKAQPLMNFHGIYSSDPEMMKLFRFIERVASCAAPFFICGETGTGKELFAKAIHLQSNRAGENFVALNCANLTESLLESQLFGHRKGSFTGASQDQRGLIAAAEKGTLFLDEVTEIPLTLQAKLLRVLQEKEYTPLGNTKPIPFDVQIISASCTSLEDAVATGKMREDLRYRLEVMPITVPPLRERGADVTALFDNLLESQLLRQGAHIRAVDSEVYEYINEYQWPGNVRELLNVCTYMAAIVQSHDELISMDCLPDNIFPFQGKKVDTVTNISRIDKKLITATLDNCYGNRNATAKTLSISRMTLWRKMKRFEILQE